MKTEYRKWISKRLISLRLFYKKTQEEIAAGIEIKRPAYASYEEGRAEPGVTILKRLSGLYNKDSIDALLADDLTQVNKSKKDNLYWSYIVLAEKDKRLVDMILSQK